MGEGLEQRYLEDIQAYNIEVERSLMIEKNGIYEEEKEIMNEIKRAGATYDKTKKSQGLVEARRAKDAFLANKDERIKSLEKIYAAKMKPIEVTKLDLAAHFFTNMFDKSSPKELFINLTVFVLLLLIEALPAVVRLKLEDGKYLSKIVHQKHMRDKADVEVESIENQILSMEGLDDLPSKLEKVRIWKELEDASKRGFQDTDRLIELAKEYKQKHESPPPPPPKTEEKKVATNDNSRQKSNDFPKFDYSKK